MASTQTHITFKYHHSSSLPLFDRRCEIWNQWHREPKVSQPRSIKGQVFAAIATLISYPWISLRERMYETKSFFCFKCLGALSEASHVLNFIIGQYLYRKKVQNKELFSSAAHDERIVQILAPTVGRQ